MIYFQCYVYESGLNDQLTINFDPSGEVLGISITAAASSCVGLDVTSANLTNWKTTVEVFQTISGPMYVIVHFTNSRVVYWCDGSSDRFFIELFLVPASAPRLV